MSFTPFQGSAGRLKALVVTPDLTVPVPAALTGTTAAVGSVTGWKVTFHDEHGDPILTFESPANAAGMLAEQQVQGGTFGWEADVEGFFDAQASVGTIGMFVTGIFLVVDFVYNKATGFGHLGAVGKVSSPSFGPGVKDGPVKFQCKLKGHGLLPAPTTPS